MKRNVTLWPLIGAVYLMTCGGPFGVEDIVSQSGYLGAILLLLITPVIWAVPTALMVAELASALPEDGGYYVWARRAMGPFWGFMGAWLSLTGSIFDMAIYPTLFVSYLEHFNPAITANGKGLWIGIALVAVSAVLNLGGARAVSFTSFAFTALLLSPFLLLSLYSAAHPGPTPVTPAPKFDFLLGLLVAMWNYMGFDNSSTIAGEVDRPQRTYPRAMAGAVPLGTLTYIVPIVAVAATGLASSKWTTGGWPDVARAVMGAGPATQIVATAITIGGMMGAFGTFNALTMALTRLPAALADDGFLPKMFARRNPKNGAPYVAVVACAVVWALALNLSFSKLVILDVLLTGGSILLDFASLVALRVRAPELPRPYRVPGGLAGAIGIGIGPLALLTLAVVRNKAEPVGPINALQLGVLLIALGVVSYSVNTRFRSKPS